MKIVVTGVGRMGAWFAKKLAPEHHVGVYDLDSEKTAQLKDIPNVTLLDKKEDISGFSPDMLINGVSLQNTVDLFREMEEFLPKNCILSDIASIKGDIPQYYRECPFRYVSVHPMFGPTFSLMEGFTRENAVIIKESCPEGIRFFEDFFHGLNLKTYYYTASEHDDMMAYSLTLPFVSSMVFAACMTETAVPGSTFARHREIAKGLLSEDDRLLSEILFSVNSLPQLAKVTSRLEFLKHVIKGRDYDEARRFFDGLRHNIGE